MSQGDAALWGTGKHRREVVVCHRHGGQQHNPTSRVTGERMSDETPKGEEDNEEGAAGYHLRPESHQPAPPICCLSPCPSIVCHYPRRGRHTHTTDDDDEHIVIDQTQGRENGRKVSKLITL